MNQRNKNQRNKKPIPKVLSILLILSIVFSSMTMTTFASDTIIDYNAELNLSRTLDTESIPFNLKDSSLNQVDINYVITPKDIPANKVQTNIEKEVVLIIDRSGSMAKNIYGGDYGTSRMSIVKSAASSFVNQLGQHANISMALIEYSNDADIFTYEGKQLLNVYNTTNRVALNNKINAITADGGTNIGDALRQAYYILENGNKKAQKYIVFMTDGEPTAFSYTNATISSTDSEYSTGTIGKYSTDFGQSFRYAYSIGMNNENYWLGSGDARNFYVNWTTTTDYNLYAETYANKAARYLKDNLSSSQNYFIAFSTLTGANKLETISANANGTYKIAATEADIQSVYQDIAKDIITDLVLEELRFEELFPSKIVPVPGQSEMTINGQSVSKTFSNISYTLNNAKTHYVAEPISFKVRVEAKAIGKYIIGANKTSGFHYIDFDQTMVHDAFNELTLEVTDSNLTGSNELHVLEVQPGRVFELSRGAIEAKFPDYEVYLTQVSMPEFVGMIEEVNGNYDIVYMGMIENFKKYQINGASTSIITDIDITNRKAAKVLEFINSGQCIVFDQDIYNYNGSKLKTNFESIKNLPNVHNVANASGNNFMNSLKGWYQAANHRPYLSMNSSPEEYNGNVSSYLSSHRLSYLYNAYNDDNKEMTINLYLDINGDGLFTTDELAKAQNITKNLSGLGLDFTVDDSFNGCMPWKLELIDRSSNTKDIEKGFVAMKGDKTIVNVLNLIPANSSLDFDNTAVFAPSLNTEEYEINIVRMHVKDFNDNYPEQVDGNQTLLNGYYDMILFGFGDSYNNQDVTNPEALEAINKFIETKQSVMFTHDLAGPSDANVNDGISFYNDAPVITENFKLDMGFSNNRTAAGTIPDTNWKAWGTETAYKQNDGLITMYPYILANTASKTLAIANTHDQYWKIDLEDPDVVPWFNLNSGNYKYYPEAYYYTFTNGTITYSGTGHSTPGGLHEQQLFVNTMLKASRGANHAPTLRVIDLFKNMNVSPKEDVIKFQLEIKDVDVKDREFVAEFYYVFGDKEILVQTRKDIKKDEFTDIVLPKTDDKLPDTVDEFILKIVVRDPHGAEAIEEYPLTHKVIPILDMEDDFESAYLVGDKIDIEYKIVTKILGDEKLISNISIDTFVDSNYFNVTSYPKFVKNGNKYTMNPVFDNSLTTTVDETDIIRQFSIIALKEGLTSIDFGGTYDMRFIVAQSIPTEELFLKDSKPVEIKIGKIGVIVSDTLTRKVEGVDVIIKDSKGNQVASGKTNIDGIFEAMNLPTDIYTAVIKEVPEFYAKGVETEKAVDLNARGDNNEQDLEFTIFDVIPPEITVDHDKSLKAKDEGFLNLPIHVLFDGVNSELAQTSVKRLSGPTSSLTEEAYKALPDTTLIATSPLLDENSNLDLNNEPLSDSDPRLRSIYQKLEQFSVTDSGYYALYAKNTSGNVTIKIIRISNIVDTKPNVL